MKWWYLSFADDTGFLGAAVVQGDDVAGAIRETHCRSINPGGEVLALEVPDGPAANADFPPEKRNRLLSREEINGKSLKDLDPVEEDTLDAHNPVTVCEAHVDALAESARDHGTDPADE